ncbi:hypothetical protein [Priestia flexa]|uniref:hypothetical protein n=1 Tax=Priestia flexa TaxID=86664 RepID=UPI00099D5F72|nr:hypothetical protein [Priestia flexa]AQX53350.1 hypothetical protein BC359_02875 [Priestia flexa]
MRRDNGRDPGDGAIEYTLEFFKGKGRAEIERLVTSFYHGELNDPNDKRIKRCDYCDYYFRDESLRNNRRTCCAGCKTSQKTLQTRIRRAEKAFLNPKPKKETKSDLYLWWLEYPCWANEQAMLEVGWRFEKPLSMQKMDYIRTREELYGEGNRKKKAEIIDYNGDTL